MPMTPEERAEFVESIKFRDAKRTRTTRLWNEKPNEVAAPGEEALANLFGGKPNAQKYRKGGDGGIDIHVLMQWLDRRGQTVKTWVIVNVKAANIPKYLLMGVDENPEEAYVLANARGELLGWEWGRELKKVPPENWMNNNRWVHKKAQGMLRPMEELTKHYAGWWKHPRHPRYCTPQPADYGKGAQSAPSFRGVCRVCRAPGMFVKGFDISTREVIWECNEHRSV